MVFLRRLLEDSRHQSWVRWEFYRLVKERLQQLHDEMDFKGGGFLHGCSAVIGMLYVAARSGLN
jgi:hypothetical protein